MTEQEAANIPEWTDRGVERLPPIKGIEVRPEVRFSVLEAVQGEAYWVGREGVTRIEATYKSGEYSHIPYVRVWQGDKPLAEFCQHKIVGVYFDV